MSNARHSYIFEFHVSFCSIYQTFWISHSCFLVLISHEKYNCLVLICHAKHNCLQQIYVLQFHTLRCSLMYSYVQNFLSHSNSVLEILLQLSSAKSLGFGLLKSARFYATLQAVLLHCLNFEYIEMCYVFHVLKTFCMMDVMTTMCLHLAPLAL